MKWLKWMGGLFGLAIAISVMSMPTMAKEKFKTFEKTTYTTNLQTDTILCETQPSVPEVATIAVVAIPVEMSQVAVLSSHYLKTEHLRRIPRRFSSMYLRTSPTSGAAYRVAEKKTRTVWKN